MTTGVVDLWVRGRTSEVQIHLLWESLEEIEKRRVSEVW